MSKIRGKKIQGNLKLKNYVKNIKKDMKNKSYCHDQVTT